MMLLQRIALERFRQLDQQAFEFRPGLNLIKGPNEAGKTTLQEAILFALLGNPRHTTLERVKTVDDRITWGQERRFSITLDFTEDSGTSYRLTKDWDAQSACLENLQTNAEETDIDSIQRAISDMLGYGSLKLLQSTVCVEQDAIDDISAGRQEIGDQLQSIITGGGEGEATASAVLDSLNDKIAEMERGWRTSAPRNPGPIKIRRDEIDSLAQRLAQMHPQVEQAEDAKEQSIALGTQIDEIEQSLTAKRALKDLCDHHFGQESERSTWRKREEELETRIECIEKAQDKMGKVEQPSDQSSKSHRSTIPLIVAGIGGFLFLMGIVVGSLGFIASSELAFVAVGALVGLPGLLLCIGGLIWLASASSRLRSTDYVAAQAQIDALLGGKTLEELAVQRREASRQRRDAEEALESPEMRQAAQVTPLEYQELRQDIDRLQAQLEEKRQQQIKCEARGDVANCSLEDVHCLEESKAAVERTLSYLEERLAIYQLTRDVIQIAKEQTMQSARDQLEPAIGACLNKITHGRYDRVEADDDLSLKVFSREKGDWVAVDNGELSRGMVDQLYLAARLALLALLYRDAKPPLLLDDPFVKFDPERREQAIALCKEIAREQQVLLFSCHNHYDSTADWTVELT